MDRFLWWALEYTDEVFECCAVNVSDSIGDDCWSCHLWLMQPEVSLTLCHLKGVLVSLWIMFQKPPDSPTRPSPAATCVKASNKSACFGFWRHVLRDGVTPPLNATAYYVTRHHRFTIAAHLLLLTSSLGPHRKNCKPNQLIWLHHPKHLSASNDSDSQTEFVRDQ